MEGVNRPLRLLASIFLLTGVKNNIFWISITLVVLSIAVITRQVLKPVDVTKDFIVMSVEIASHNLPLVMTSCCLIFTNLRRNCFQQFSREMRALKKKFESLGFPVDRRERARFERRLAGILLLKIGAQQIPFLTKGFPWNEFNYLEFIIQNVPLLVLHTFLSLWILHVNNLRILFKTLNSMLRTIHHQQNWMAQDFRALRKSTHHRRVLQACASLYDSLWSQSRQLNAVFAPQILSIIPSVFIVVIFNSFQTFKVIKERMVLEASWIIFDLLYFEVLFELVVPCILVQDESEKFKETLLKMSGSEGLILQSHHQKVEFSACAIFPLDGSLIYTILGALTTYLVILLQFD